MLNDHQSSHQEYDKQASTDSLRGSRNIMFCCAALTMLMQSQWKAGASLSHGTQLHDSHANQQAQQCQQSSGIALPISTYDK